MTQGLDIYNDLEAYDTMLGKTMQEAEDILSMKDRVLSDLEREKLKKRLPILVRTLRTMLKTQLSANSEIVKLDRSDGSYDNAALDEKLRLQLSALRDFNTDLTRSWGSRTIRKVTAWLSEDLPSWFTVRKNQVMDFFRPVLSLLGVVGGAVGVGYMVANKGVVPGIRRMSEDVTSVAESVTKPVSRWLGDNNISMDRATDAISSVILGQTESDRAASTEWLQKGTNVLLGGEHSNSMDWLKFGAESLLKANATSDE